MKTRIILKRLFSICGVALLLGGGAAMGASAARPASDAPPELPDLLSKTGLYEPGTVTVARD